MRFELQQSVQTIKSRFFVTRAVGVALITLIVLSLVMACLKVVLTTTQLVSWGWLETTLDWVLGLGGLVGSIFLFPLFMPLIASLMVDYLASQIEKREYGFSESPDVPLLPMIWGGVRFALWALMLNLLNLMLIFIVPPLWFVSHLLINGKLLGREFFELVAMRHKTMDEVRTLYAQLKTPIWMMGSVIAGIMFIPVVNLITPLLAVVVMVHFYWTTQGKHPKSSELPSQSQSES